MSRKAASARSAEAARRAMVIATNFPPDAAVGTMRTLRLVRHLANSGWDVDVVTAAPERFHPGTVVDPALLDKIPPAVYVLRPRAWRPFERLSALIRGRRARRSSEAPIVSSTVSQPPAAISTSPGMSALVFAAIRACLTIPDKEASWTIPAIVAAWRRAGAHRPDVIYSSGPPFTSHLVAMVVASLCRCRWVADFRDPWARAPWRHDKFAFEKRAWRVLERLFVTRADAVVFVTETNRREFADFYGDTLASRFHVVPNGCDVSDFEGLVRNRPEGAPFVLLHAGSLYGARNPTPLFHAVTNAIARGAIQRDRIRVRFMGRIGIPGVNLPAIVRDLGLDDVVEFVAHVPRRAILQEMIDASALLIVQPVTTVSVPAKLYEYMASGRPVLAMAEPEGETAEVIQKSGGGGVVAAEDEGAIEQALLALIGGGADAFIATAPAAYDGALRANQMVRLLAEVAGRREQRRAA